MSIEQGTDVYASSGKVAAATATASLPAAAGQLTYLTGFDVTGLGATAGSAVTMTVSGLAIGTISFLVAVPAGVLVPLAMMTFRTPTGRPWAGAMDTAIVVSCPTFGSGNTAACVNAYGYQL